jgi:hypothetical protein
MLARLFDADRASLLTRLVLDAVETFDIDLSRLHNDSTSIKLSGAYDTADGQERGGKPTPAVEHGFSKDHRPDLKQLVWMLTVTADGAVPIAFRVADGNTADVTTHIDTWNALVALTGEVGFLYVADSKLATFDNVAHIHTRGGRFLSVLPAARREDRIFRDWVVTNTPDWTEIAAAPPATPTIPRTSSRPTRTICPPPTGTGSCGSTPPPRPAVTRPAATRPSPKPSPRSTRSTSGCPPHAAGSRPPSRPRPKPASHRRAQRHPLGPHPRRDRHRRELPAGQAGPSRPQHRLQEDHPHHAADPVRPSTRPRSPTTPPPTGCGR